MANLLDIRRRIRSVRNTRQITKAMQMVSAARLRRAQERALAARPYAQMLTSLLKSLVSRAEIYDPVTGEPQHPLLVRRPEQTLTLIVVSGERGLAGAFNSNILKAASNFIASKGDRNIDIISVGRKSREYFRRRYPSATAEGDARQGRIQMIADYVGLLNRAQFASAAEIGELVVRQYSEAKTDAVYLVYNEFKSVIAQRLVVDDVLPVVQIGEVVHEVAEEISEETRKKNIEAAKHAGVGVRAAETKEIDQKAAAVGAEGDYIYEQEPKELFTGLLPRYVSVQLYRAMLESEAAEHAARMTAMDAATSNAADMIDSLTLALNRARQAKITREIIEIVSGAAAL